MPGVAVETEVMRRKEVARLEEPTPEWVGPDWVGPERISTKRWGQQSSAGRTAPRIDRCVHVVREAQPTWGNDGAERERESPNEEAEDGRPVSSRHEAAPQHVSAETSETPDPESPASKAADDEIPESKTADDETPDPDAPNPEAPDYDALQSLGDEIAVLAAHIHAATRRLLVLMVRFDRLRGWEVAGFRSCAHWLAYRTGIGLGAAREKVRAARALEDLPETSASMARGELSFSKVRALTRVATPESEGELLEVARASTARNLERFVRAWRTLGREDEARAERIRHRLRRFAVVPDDDGMYVVRGRLDPEVGALLMRAVEAASDALYRAERRKSFDPAAEVTPEQRRADALGLLAERALAAGFGATAASAQTSDDAELELPAGEGTLDPSEHASAPKHVSAETSSPLSGTRAARYQVFLHVDRDTLDPASEPGRSHLEDGTRVCAETSRRLTCDAAVVRVERGGGGSTPGTGDSTPGAGGSARGEGSAPDGEGGSAGATPVGSEPGLGRGFGGSVLDVGRRTRTVPPALRRALEIRDRGCRFPGCGLRFADAHHVKHWADGGRTRLGNLVLLCRFHHRLVHEEGWRVLLGEGGRVPVFVDPRGRMHAEAPPRVDLEEARVDLEGTCKSACDPSAATASQGESPAARLLHENRERGVEPDYRTATARCKRDAEMPVEVYDRALEAMERAGDDRDGAGDGGAEVNQRSELDEGSDAKGSADADMDVDEVGPGSP